MKIIENSKSHLSEFISLNEEWISEHFTIEEVDRKLAAHPYQIVEQGGYIFSLLSSGKVLGVCALFNNGGNVYELARMAVSTKSRGLGYGEKLIAHSLVKAKEIGAKKVYLVSNTKLVAAVALYKKYGFNVVSEGPHPVYSRANIVMQRVAL